MADWETADVSLRERVRGIMKPYEGEPPPGIYRPSRPDKIIRLAATLVPHALSVIMKLGGEAELPPLPAAVNRKTMVVVDRRTIAHDEDVVALTLAAADGSALREWHAGAHVDVYLPSGRVRQYSLCGDPGDDRQYRIAVRRIPQGGGGSIEVHELAEGATVEISEPRNAFLMPVPGSGSRASKLHFIAGGIGITPILPMVLVAERLGVPWTLHYTGRHRGSLPFLDQLLEFGDKVHVRTDDEQGLPTAADLLYGVDDATAVYTCGPPLLIEAIRGSIPADSGIELHVERFSPLPVVDGEAFELELASTGEVVQVEAHATALSALRAARPNVGYSCQQGFCGTCAQTVLAGSVEHRDRTLTEVQREQGRMLMCVSRAAGGRLVLDV